MENNTHLDPEEIEIILQAFHVVTTNAWEAFSERYELATGEEPDEDKMEALEKKLRELVS